MFSKTFNIGFDFHLGFETLEIFISDLLYPKIVIKICQIEIAALLFSFSFQKKIVILILIGKLGCCVAEYLLHNVLSFFQLGYFFVWILFCIFSLIFMKFFLI